MCWWWSWCRLAAVLGRLVVSKTLSFVRPGGCTARRMLRISLSLCWQVQMRRGRYIFVEQMTPSRLSAAPPWGQMAAHPHVDA
eukprot:8632690-Pyramimonas_sp.AAC.1